MYWILAEEVVRDYRGGRGRIDQAGSDEGRLVLGMRPRIGACLIVRRPYSHRGLRSSFKYLQIVLSGRSGTRPQGIQAAGYRPWEL